MKRLRLAGILALVVGVALVTVSVASAHVQTLTVSDRADRQDEGNLVIVSGTVRCTAGETAIVSVNLEQTRGQFNVSSKGQSPQLRCTGGINGWSAVVLVEPGPSSPFRNGPALATVTVFTAPDFVDSLPIQQRVQLH